MDQGKRWLGSFLLAGIAWFGAAAPTGAAQEAEPWRGAPYSACGYDREPYLLDSGPHLFVDYPKAPPEQRFKIVYQSRGSPQEMASIKANHPQSVTPYWGERGFLIRLASSPDGIHWTPMPDPLVSHVGDTQTRVEYDPTLGRYVGFFRMTYMNHRAIGRSEGTDLKFWPAPRPVLFPEPNNDDPGDDYYINGYCRYPGTSSMHLMVATIFKRYSDTTELKLAASMDGDKWAWIPGGPVLQPGPLGTWDGGCIFAGSQLTELPGDRVAVPYAGYVYPHKFPRYARHGGQIGLAVWPKERLSALVADQDGELTIGTVRARGDRLMLNFSTLRNGYVRVAIEGKPGRALEDCDPLFGDQLKKEVTWKGQNSIGVKPGEGFQMRIQLRAAKLYSFEFK